MSKRKMRRFQFEQLEKRQLLAADFAVGMIQCDSMPAEQCETVSTDFVDSEVEIDFDETELPVGEPDQGFEATTGGAEPTDDGMVENAIVENRGGGGDFNEAESDLETGQPIDEGIVDATEEAAELTDPVLGTVGYFGKLDADNTQTRMEMTPSLDGELNVVVSTSFGDSETRLEITDGEGELIVETMTEELDGFQKVSFDVNEGETYQVTVSTDESGDGYFQVTASFVESTQETANLESDPVDDPATVPTPDTGVEGGSEDEHDAELDSDCDPILDVETEPGEPVLEEPIVGEPLDVDPNEADPADEPIDTEPVTEDVIVGETDEPDNEGSQLDGGESEVDESDVIEDATDVPVSEVVDSEAPNDDDHEPGQDVDLDQPVVDAEQPAVDEVTVDPVVEEISIDENSAEAEVIALVDNCASLTGELAMPGEVDSFRFVADSNGRATLNVTELMSDNGTELEISVLNGLAEEVARGLTNESVEVSFDVSAGDEYVITLSAVGDQTGSYDLALETVADPIDPATLDQHVDEIGEEATLLTVENGIVSLDGALETGADRDAFRFVAPSDGELVLDMSSASENFESNAQVTVFNSSGEPIVSGSTNEDVAIRFNTDAGSEYQILIDSTNDVATDFSLSMTEDNALVANPGDGSEDPLAGSDDENLPLEDELLAESNVCLEDEIENELRAEVERIDAAFSSLSDLIESELDLFERHLHATQWLPWFMRS